MFLTTANTLPTKFTELATLVLNYAQIAKVFVQHVNIPIITSSLKHSVRNGG